MVDFNTYVINLEKDKKNWLKLQSSLHDRGIDLIRFNAIYGKYIKDINVYKDLLSTLCKNTCPYSVIGLGLSHLTLGQEIYEKDVNEHALILEDDVVPEFNNKNQISEIIENMPRDCDILLLYCHGMCEGNATYTKKNAEYGFPFIGSTAAYVITKNALRHKQKLKTHIDIQLYSSDLNIYVYNGPRVFSVPPVEENPSSNSQKFVSPPWNPILSKMLGLQNITVLELLNYNVFRIPVLNIELTSQQIIIICFIVFYWISQTRSS